MFLSGVYVTVKQVEGQQSYEYYGTYCPLPERCCCDNAEFHDASFDALVELFLDGLRARVPLP